MKNEYVNAQKALEELYSEKFEYTQSNPDYAPEQADRQHKIDQLAHRIERHLKGVINYYNKTKDEAERTSRDGKALELLEQLELTLRKDLAQFNHF